MAIRSILVHLAIDDDRTARLRAGIAIAEALEAHLICLYVAAAVHMPAGSTGRGASSAYLAEARRIGKERQEGIKNEVAEACGKSGISWEWVTGETDHFENLMEHVHRTDLTILTQAQLNHLEDRLMFQMPELVIQHAGGPVMILPKGKEPPNLTQPVHMMIAWRYSKEAIRAVRDTLPIMHRSRKVSLLPIEAESGDHQSPELIKAYLAQHHIAVELVGDTQSDLSGEEILDKAHEIGADRICLGAYDRNSFREMVFFGPSRYVLSHTDIPVFMSH